MYTIIIKNTSGSIGVWCGKEFAVDEEFTVPQDANKPKWTQNSTLIDSISAGDLQVGNGSVFYTDTNQAINWLKGELVPELPPFATKTVPGTTSKLFKRDTGKSFAVSAGSNNCDFVIPFNLMKITGVEIINTEIGDYCDFEVYDTPAGTISGYPDVKINQFGYSVYLSKDYYERMCQYDADVIKDMKVRIVYNSVSTKTIYVNYIIHEVV